MQLSNVQNVIINTGHWRQRKQLQSILRLATAVTRYLWTHCNIAVTSTDDHTVYYADDATVNNTTNYYNSEISNSVFRTPHIG